jgi:hypothetical protein
MKTYLRRLSTLLGPALLACGAPQPTAALSAVPVSAPAGSAAAASSTLSVPSASATAVPPVSQVPAEPKPPEHPFAATSSEATSLIDAAIDSRSQSLIPCIVAARARRKNAHDKIQIEVGLDEQGHLMGVEAPRGAPKDVELFACAQKALAGANFPTSHAGIITVTKTFEDQAVYK